MKVVFLNKPKSRHVLAAHVTECAKAFLHGVKLHGHTTDIVSVSDKIPDADVYCLGGGYQKSLYDTLRKRGHVLYFDKGYFRHRSVPPAGPIRKPTDICWEYWRVSVNAHHPTHYLSYAKHGPERWNILAERHGCYFRKWRPGKRFILFAGSSANYHRVAGLGDPNDVAQEAVNKLNAMATGLVVMYRPKPSWPGARVLAGALFHTPGQKLEHLLDDAACLVTYGSNAALDAMMWGVPSVILGDGILKHISSTKLEDVASPYMATVDERQQLLNNLMWRQFTAEEMRRGLAWAAIVPEFKGRTVREEKLPFIAGSSILSPDPGPLRVKGDFHISWLDPKEFKRAVSKEFRRVSREKAKLEKKAKKVQSYED